MKIDFILYYGMKKYIKSNFDLGKRLVKHKLKFNILNRVNINCRV